MNQRILGMAAILGWMLSASIPAAAQKPVIGEWMVPKVKAGEYPIKRVVILPAQFNLSKDTMKGRQSLESENMRVAPTFDKAILTVLGRMGLNAAAGSSDLLAASPEFRASVGTLQQGFDSVSPLLMKKPKEVKKGRFKVDEQTMSSVGIKDLAKQDAILFVRGTGGRQTKSKAFAMGGGLVGAAFAGGLRINVVMSFVDAVTGEVLYVKGGLMKVHDTDSEKNMVKDLEDWLKNGKGKVFASGQPQTPLS